MKRLEPISLPLFVAVGFACAMPAAALPKQGQGGSQQYAHFQYPQSSSTDDLRLPTTAANPVPADYDFFEVGDWNGDGDPDAIMVAGGEAHALFGIDRFEHSELLDGSATKARFELPVGSTGVQPILVSGAAGLVRHTIDPTTGLVAAPVTLKSGAAWQNVPILEPANLNNVGRSDLVVVLANDPNRVQLWSGNGSLNFSYVGHFDLSHDIEAVATLDWDGDGVNEVAALSESTLEIYSSTTGLVASWSVPAAGGSIERLPGTAAQPGDHLLWVRPASSPTHTYDDLMVLSAANPAPAPVRLEFRLTAGLLTTPIDVTGLDVGDVDNDGDLDILMGHTTGPSTVILGNQGTSAVAFSNDEDDYAVFLYDDDPQLAGEERYAAPAFVDFDNDGRSEVMMPNDSEGKVVYETSVPLFEPNLQVYIDPGTVINLFHDNFYAVDNQGPSLVVEGPMAILTVLDEPIQTGGYTHVNVQVFEQDSPTSYLNSNGLWDAYIELQDAEPNSILTQVAVHADWGEPVHNPWPAGRHLYFSVRFLRWDGDVGDYVERSKWWNQAITVDDGDPNYDAFLAGNPYLLAMRSLSGWDGELPEPGGGVPQTLLLGVSADLSRIGGFGAPPSPPAEETIPKLDTSPVLAYFWDQEYQ